MTVNEPEIILCGGDVTPSAPPTPFDEVAPSSAAALPIAVAVGARLSAVAPAPACVTSSTGADIEQCINSDGSLEVKFTTVTRRPSGYREVTTEIYHVPADAAIDAGKALDAGEPPSVLYMTRMEQRVLPPMVGQVVVRPPAGTPISEVSYPDSDKDADALRHPQKGKATHHDPSGGPRACALRLLGRRLSFGRTRRGWRCRHGKGKW